MVSTLHLFTRRIVIKGNSIHLGRGKYLFKEYDQRQHSAPHIGAIQCLNNGTLEKLKEEPSVEERRERLEIRTIRFGLSNGSVSCPPKNSW